MGPKKVSPALSVRLYDRIRAAGFVPRGDVRSLLEDVQVPDLWRALDGLVKDGLVVKGGGGYRAGGGPAVARSPASGEGEPATNTSESPRVLAPSDSTPPAEDAAPPQGETGSGTPNAAPPDGAPYGSLDWVAFGKRVKAKRTAASLSQAQLGRQLGIAQGSLGFVERGQRASAGARPYAILREWLGEAPTEPAPKPEPKKPSQVDEQLLELGRRVREKREALKLSQRQLSAALGVGAAVTEWVEAGRKKLVSKPIADRYEDWLRGLVPSLPIRGTVETDAPQPPAVSPEVPAALVQEPTAERGSRTPAVPRPLDPVKVRAAVKAAHDAFSSLDMYEEWVREKRAVLNEAVAALRKVLR